MYQLTCSPRLSATFSSSARSSSFGKVPLIDDVQGTRQMDVLGVELTPDGECARLVRFKADSLGFSRLDDFLDAVGVDGEPFADRRLVLYLNIYCGVFLDNQGFRFIEYVKGADVLDCHAFDLELENLGVISINNYREILIPCLRRPYHQAKRKTGQHCFVYFHHYSPLHKFTFNYMAFKEQYSRLDDNGC